MSRKYSNLNPTTNSTQFLDPYQDRRGTGPVRPREPLPQEKPDLWDLGDGLAMAWLGHSSIFLRMNGKNILIDPIFSRYSSPVPFVGPKRFPGNAITPAQLPEIDLVLITHNHYDHLDRATIRALDGQVGQYIAPSGVGGNLRRFGIQSSKITELGWYEETSVDGLTVICTPSQHNSSRTILDWNRTLWGSYVLKDGAHTVFDFGDGGFGNHFSEIRERYGAPDLAIMECGQYGEKWHTTHMFPEESVQACRMLEAKLAVPVHWGAYVLSNHPWDDPPRRFRQRAEELNQCFRIPVLNQVIPVP